MQGVKGKDDFISLNLLKFFPLPTGSAPLKFLTDPGKKRILADPSSETLLLLCLA